jgi:hypothetical protein
MKCQTFINQYLGDMGFRNRHQNKLMGRREIIVQYTQSGALAGLPTTCCVDVSKTLLDAGQMSGRTIGVRWGFTGRCYLTIHTVVWIEDVIVRDLHGRSSGRWGWRTYDEYTFINMTNLRLSSGRWGWRTYDEYTFINMTNWRLSSGNEPFVIFWRSKVCSVFVSSMRLLFRHRTKATCIYSLVALRNERQRIAHITVDHYHI